MKHLGKAASREDEPTRSLFFVVLEAAAVLQNQLEDGLQEIGLSRAKMEVLHNLSRAPGGIPLRALAAMQKCAPSNMTTLIDRMAADGLVRRAPSSVDRRSVRAELTPEGIRLAAAGYEVVRRLEEAFAASLPPQERDALEQIFRSYTH